MITHSRYGNSPIKSYGLHAVMFFVAVSLSTPLTALAFAPEREVEVTLDVGDTVLRVEGQTAPGAFVTIKENGATTGTVTASSNGRFAKSFSSRQPGLRNIKVFARTSNGELTDTVTKNVNLAPQSETIVKLFLPTTFSVSSDRVVRGDTVTFRGFTIPEGQAAIIVDNNLTYTATANLDGHWTRTISTNGFYVGTHFVHSIVSDQHGNQSASTAKQAFQVAREDRDEAVDEREDTPRYIQPPAISSSRNNQRFSTSPIEIRGVALANAQVEIWEDGSIIGSVFANHLGRWSFNMRLTEPRHNIRIRACVEEVCSEFSDIITIYFDDNTLDSSELLFFLSKYRYFNVMVDEPIDLELLSSGGETPYEAVLDWGDNTVETVTIQKQGDIKFGHAYTEPGNYTGIVTLKDDSEETLTRYFSVQVSEEDTGGTNLFVPFSIIALIAATGGISLLFKKHQYNSMND